MRIAGQKRAIAVVHGNRGILTKRNGCKELLEMSRRDRSCDDTEKLALQPRYLERDHGCPAPGETALHQLDQNRCRCRSRFEGFEEGSITDVEVANGPAFRRIDQHSL